MLTLTVNIIYSIIDCPPYLQVNVKKDCLNVYLSNYEKTKNAYRCNCEYVYNTKDTLTKIYKINFTTNHCK